MKKLTIILIQLITFSLLSISIKAYPLGQIPINPMSFEVEMLHWEEVNKLIPKYASFEVIDIETGLHFNVQRRAGKNHADVQPLTYRDTRIMKKIYGNQWSWNRRAIIVNLENHLIAASMHGMPHGAGAIRNGFPGHFCIHFYGSKLHTSNNTDLAHQIMIHKVAGKLEGYIDQFSPHQLIDAFLVAINQKDEQLLREILLDKKTAKEVIDKTNEIKRMKRISVYFKDDEKNNLYIEIPVEVGIYTVSSKQFKQILKFVFARKNLMEPWGLTRIEYLD